MIILWLTKLIAKISYPGLRRFLFAIVDNWRFLLIAIAGLIVLVWLLSWTSFCGSSGTNKKIEKLEQGIANISENIAIKKSEVNAAINEVNNAQTIANQFTANSKTALGAVNKAKANKSVNATRDSILKELDENEN